MKSNENKDNQNKKRLGKKGLIGLIAGSITVLGFGIWGLSNIGDSDNENSK